MAIYPFSNAYVINKDGVAGSSFKAGMVLMINSAGNVIAADPQTLSSKPIEQIQTLIVGFAAGDSNVTGNTIIVPDYIGSNYLDANSKFVSISDREYVTVRRQLLDYADETVNDYYNINYSSVPKRTGIGVYPMSGESYATDQFVPVLHGDFGVDGIFTQTINPGDYLTIGSGINAGKLVKVNLNSVGKDIIVVGVVERFDTNTRLLYFKSSIYTLKLSSNSAIMALDAGNIYSYPNTGTIGTVCGSVGESGSFILTAPVGHVFDKVLFASYGTPEGTCQLYTQGSCHAVTSQSIVEGWLLGNNSATLHANNFFFGDPCGGISKRLYVQARFAPVQAKDLTVNNNNGTLTNGVTYDTAGGGSWSFDGTNDFISVPITNFTLTNASFTAMCWVYLTLPASGTFFHLGDNNNGITMGVGLSDTQTPGTKVIVLYPLQRWVNYTYNLGTYSNGWNFVAISVDSAKFPTVYLNNNPGTYVALNDARTPTLNTMTIGTELPGFRYITGKLTDVRLYNRPLTATEIAAYYNNTKSRYGL